MIENVTPHIRRLLEIKLKDYFRRCPPRSDNPTSRKGLKLMADVKVEFSLHDVCEKFGNPMSWVCQLTGDPLDITNPSTFSFDHLTPVTRGGSSTLDNFTICSSHVNGFKSKRSLGELLNYCVQTLTEHGVVVSGVVDVVEQEPHPIQREDSYLGLCVSILHHHGFVMDEATKEFPKPVPKVPKKRHKKVLTLPNTYHPVEFDEIDADDGIPDEVWETTS